MILHQPLQGNLGDILINKLNSNLYNRLGIIVAYAKMSGVSRIEDTVKYFKSNGGKVHMIVGIDQKNTSYEALKKLYILSDTLTIVHNENLSHTFHHKVYLLDNTSNTNKAWMAVGSNNLTAGGLFINYESFFLSELNLSDSSDYQSYLNTTNLFSHYYSNTSGLSYAITSESQIDILYQNGYIMKEKDTQITFARSSSQDNQNSASTRIFGRESFKAPLLDQTTSVSHLTSAQISVDEITNNIIPNSNINEIYWFEMRRSTGGSRNILDLSMTGTIVASNDRLYPVNRNIHGGITFFDIEPSFHQIEKDITISYLGNDYFPSTIKFAPNNGSWRVQLKGNSSTDSLALSQHGSNQEFVDKILVFQKVSTDYYVLEILDGFELSSLESRSIFSAVNGTNLRSKKFGKLK